MSAIRGQTTMYVAKDLAFWFTNEPHHFAERVTVNGKAYVRLTPAVVTWLKTRVIAAEGALEAGKVSMAELCRIVDAFCPVYEFAVNSGIISWTCPTECTLSHALSQPEKCA